MEIHFYDLVIDKENGEKVFQRFFEFSKISDQFLKKILKKI